jgi:hypothetical protein
MSDDDDGMLLATLPRTGRRYHGIEIIALMFRVFLVIVVVVAGGC